eukprot:INCI5783.1.p1 GENE.INCI5783.1~~INCI5783.1.p1  ORF type:complete len:328 (+),score=59.19 INCI5783.1:135-1118(+)
MAYQLALLFIVAVLALLSRTTTAVIVASSETECHNQFGRWVTVTMKDSGIPTNGWEGNYLHFQNDQLEDLHTFTLADDLSVASESFCLDYFGDEFSKCYTIYMDDQGYNPQQVSWTVKITTRNNGASWRTSDGIDEWVSGGSDTHGWNPDTGKMEAVKTGGCPADVKVLCGRLFKKLGRYSMKQIDKVGIDKMTSEDNMLYKSQGALEKIEAQAQLLNLYVANSDNPGFVDKSDWFSGDATTAMTTTSAATTSGSTTTTQDDSCEDCPSGCTGCAVKSWRGDGQCDDDNNNCGCNWDAGDCCNPAATTLYCTDCSCLDPDYRRALRG